MRYTIALLLLIAAVACGGPPPATPTPKPTAATSMPKSTVTPTPVPTPQPTETPVPTPTVTPQPVETRYNVPANRVLTIDRLSRQKEREWTDGDPIIIVGCHTGVTVSDLGEQWYTFSRDGRFNGGNYMAGVTGFKTIPWRGACMEMAVTHDGFTRFCYYDSDGLDLSPCSFGNGWFQETPLLYLVNPESVDVLSRDQWREQYGKKE